MVARLPVPGADDGDWGDVLNEFLEVSLNGDGTVKPPALVAAGGVMSVNTLTPQANGNVTLTAANVGAYAKPASGIPSTDMTSAVQTSLTLASSSLQLGGDLGGTTSSPTIAKLQGITLTGSPSSGQVLSYNGSQWAPATVSSATINDASSTTKGIIQLAGDLNGGSAASPQVTATHLTTALPVSQGGTGQASQQAALNALSGTQSAGKYLRSDGTNTTLSAIQAADVPTLNQSTTGNAATATLAATVTTNANLTGDVTSTGNATTLVGTTNVEGIISANSTVASKAPIANPTFTGKVTTPALQVTTGAGTSGQYLTSDASGNATWQAPLSANRQNVTTKASSYSLTTNDEVVLADASSGALTITLPTAAGNTNLYAVKKIDGSGNAVTVATMGGQTVDGGASAVVQVQYASISVVSDGANWFII